MLPSPLPKAKKSTEKPKETSPLDKWYKATQNPIWKDLPQEKKQELRNEFISRFEDSPEDVKTAVSLATIDNENDLFFSKEFEQADDGLKKKYIQAWQKANEGISGKKANLMADAMLNKYYRQGGIAGVARYPLGIGQTIANLGVAPGALDEAVSLNEQLAARNPDVATAAEIGTNVAGAVIAAPTKLLAKTAPAVASKLPSVGSVLSSAGKWIAKTPYLRNLLPAAATGVAVGLETAVTSPVNVVGGTPEERQDFYTTEKLRQAATGAVLGGGLKIATSPPVREMAVKSGRWLGAFGSEGKKFSDIADDIISTTQKEYPNLATEDIISQAQDLAKKISKIPSDEAGVKIPEILNTNEFGKTLSRMQGDAPIPNLQVFIADNFGVGAKGTAGKIKATTPDTATLSKKFFDRYVLPKKAVGKVQGAAKIKEIEDEFTATANKLYDTLKPENIGLTKTQLANRTKDFLNRPDIQPQSVTVRSNPAIANILDVPKKGKKIKTRLTAKDLQEYIQQSFETLDNVGGTGGTQIKAFVDDVLRPALGENAGKLVDDVYAQYLQMSAQKKLQTEAISLANSRALKEIEAKNPIIGTIAKTINEAEIPTKVLDNIKSGKVVPKHIQELDPEDLPPIKALVLSDINNIFKNADTDVELNNALADFYQGYVKNTEALNTLRSLVKNDKNVASNINKLVKLTSGAQKQLTNLQSKVKEGSAAEAVGKGLTREFTQLGTLTISQGSRLIDSLQRQTRRILRESSIDPIKTLRLLKESERIGKGSVDYVDIWKNSQGIPATLKGTLGTGGNEVEAGDVTPVTQTEQPPSMSMEELRNEYLQPTEDLTNPKENVTLEDELLKANIHPAFEKFVYDVAGIESNFNPDTDLKNPDSSARGPFQIIDSTWEDVTQRLGLEERLGRKLSRDNIQDNVLVAAALAENNRQELKKAGVTPSASNLYVAHAWGVAGAKKLFRYANKGVAIEDIMPMDAIDGHPLFAKPGMTVDEVLFNTKKYFNDRKNSKNKTSLMEAARTNVG